MIGRFSVGKGVLLPMDDGAREMCVTPGDVVTVETVPVRDMHFHRHVFAVIGDLAKATGQTPEWMRVQLLVFAGMYQVIGDENGVTVIAPQSMSRSMMTDEALHKFWDKAKPIIAEKILPRVRNPEQRETLAKSVMAF